MSNLIKFQNKQQLTTDLTDLDKQERKEAMLHILEETRKIIESDEEDLDSLVIIGTAIDEESKAVQCFSYPISFSLIGAIEDLKVHLISLMRS